MLGNETHFSVFNYEISGAVKIPKFGAKKFISNKKCFSSGAQERKILDACEQKWNIHACLLGWFSAKGAPRCSSQSINQSRYSECTCRANKERTFEDFLTQHNCTPRHLRSRCRRAGYWPADRAHSRNARVQSPTRYFAPRFSAVAAAAPADTGDSHFVDPTGDNHSSPAVAVRRTVVAGTVAGTSSDCHRLTPRTPKRRFAVSGVGCSGCFGAAVAAAAARRSGDLGWRSRGHRRWDFDGGVGRWSDDPLGPAGPRGDRAMSSGSWSMIPGSSVLVVGLWQDSKMGLIGGWFGNFTNFQENFGPILVTSEIHAENFWPCNNLILPSFNKISEFWVCFVANRFFSFTRCGSYFGTIVEAVQCLTYQTEWNVRTCKKETKHTFFGVCGCGGRKNFYTLSPNYAQSPKKPWKISLSYSFCSWHGSFRHGEMKIWLCWYIQHVTRYIGTDFVEESRQKMQRSEEEHFFLEGCFDREEYISNTANKRCSRQVLQLRCSSSYSIKFHT